MASLTNSATETGFTVTCNCQQPPALEPCLFPQDGDQEKESGAEQIAIAPVSLVPLADISAEPGYNPASVLGPAWCLLLRYFVGQSEVAFDATYVDEELRSHSYIVSAAGLGRLSANDLILSLEKSIAAIDCDCDSEVPNTPLESKQTACFDTSVILYNVPEASAMKASLKKNSILELRILQKDDGLSCHISYDTSKISKTRADEVVSTLNSILQYMLSNPDLPLTQINLFSDAQRRAFNDRLQNTPAPSKYLLHDLMESHAIASPNSIAVCGWDRSFTYEQLKEHAYRLTHHLRTLGVGAGAIVPILSVKSAWVPVVIVGILKTGAAFLTMDPSHPAERLASIIARVSAKVTVCSACPPTIEEHVLPKVKHLIRLSEIPDLPDVPSNAEFFEMQANTHPAYIIFTSGSTGSPKGVVIDHSAIVTSSLAFGKALKFSSDSRILQFAGHFFDVCIMELCTTLVFGGVVCIPSEEERLGDIAAAMERMEVNTTFFTPTFARVIHPDDVPSLKNLVLGGEPMQVDNITRWVPRVTLFNCYGPAESSVISSVQEMTMISNPKNVGPPFGCSYWIVNFDDYNLLCPDGTLGELVIMGPIVGLSYLNNPVESSKSFIKQPDWFHDGTFSGSENRIYRTGDAAYLNPDGTVMIIGRRNNQIKLHGQRIELGEVEFNVRQVLPAQSNAVVDIISPGNDERNKQLAAFIVLPKGKNGDASNISVDKSLLPLLEKLRTDLLSRLPDYMCPSVLIPLAKMPETTSNKVDRKALRAMGTAKTLHEIAAYNGIELTYREPITVEEIKMQILWSQILNIETWEIGMESSFLHLGGDSIKAILLVAAARKAGYLVSFQNIFTNPKLSALALTMQKISDTSTVSIEPFTIVSTPEANRFALSQIKDAGLSDKDIEDYYPSTAEQDRTFRQTLINPESHVIIRAYQLGQEIDVEKFRQAWNYVVEVTPILRTRLVSLGDSTSLQVVMKEGIQWQDLEDSAEDARPLPVEFGKPLASWSITKSKVAGDDKFFVWAVHHTLMDGWSFPLISKAVTYAYENRKAPPVTASFNALIKYYESRDQEETDNFWRSELEDARAPENLFCFPSKSYVPFQTSRKETKVVLPKLLDSDITMSTVIQVAFALALLQYENSYDIVFRTTGTGRNQPVADIQEIIGAVLTSFPVRISVDLDESLAELLELTQDHGLEVSKYEYRGIEHIKNLADNSHGIVCDSNSPYLIVQTEAWYKTLDGMTLLPSKLPFSQTPLSVCCILKPDGMKIATGFDNRVIYEAKVDEILHRLEHLVRLILTNLNDKDGSMTVDELLTNLNSKNGHMTIDELFKLVDHTEER